ncbi:VCBS repeat-containing protein [Streptomyces sp. YC504]|uniref:VCBS repeat-containing protein n=1 Tax=Streptomyces mesophilus TaxID=1775132 RepID=A0A6G4XIG2_9ACTN|nr:VCBS repeat-containing protein [Streptomyces mesophilus]NGO77013.1 VCBS repeat-containing protein [Streptomyces mesophilus]
MTPTSRRAVRLASALIAAGLTVSALPALAHAEDEPKPRKLTEQQAAALAERLEVDPYAAVTGAEAEQAPLQEAAGKLTATPVHRMETVRGLAATAPLAGTRGGYAVLHSLGTVGRYTPDGTRLWQRDNLSLYEDWQVKPQRVYQPEPYPARITMGLNAVSPTAATSEHGYSTGDLTGDGVADVVFTAEVGVAPYRPFTSPGSTLPNGTFVTVLDGRTGRTLWSKLYADAQHVKIVDGTLLVSDQPSANQNAPADAKSALHGIRFSYAEGKLTPSSTWTYETGERAGRWGSVEPLGQGLFAVSWNKRQTPTTAPEGHTLVLDSRDGSVVWKADGALYSRQLHLDAARGRVVALEQSDVRAGLTYELASYDVQSGERTTLDTRVNAVAVNLQVGDLTGDRKPEYVLSEDTLDPVGFVNATTVRALDGAANELWSHTVKREEANAKDGPTAFGLQITDRQVLVSYLITEGKDTAANFASGRTAQLTSLAGRDGSVRWDKKGAVASQLYVQPFTVDGDTYARTVDHDQNIRTYRVGSGRLDELTPLQGDLSFAQAVDVNGDGKKDVVTGGESRGLWAYDGPSLAAGQRKVLWTRTMPGRVYDLELADTTGDGKPELLVAADTDTVVLGARDGRELVRIDGGDSFVRSVTGSDLDRDGRAEVIVPTDKVRVYSASGRLKWAYAPTGERVAFSDVSVADGRVVATYNSAGTLAGDDIETAGVALDARTGAVAWTAEPSADVRSALLEHGTFASEEIPYAGGRAVVLSWIVKAEVGFGTVVEIRDARTGERLHSAAVGGAHSVGNWFTGEEGLVLGATAQFRTFAADGVDHRMSTVAPVQGGAFANGPGGRRLLVGGMESGLGFYDRSLLTTSDSHVSYEAGDTTFASRNLLVADLDGDGVDEIVGLSFDQVGHDLATELAGTRYRLGDDDLHGLVVVKLATS